MAPGLIRAAVVVAAFASCFLAFAGTALAADREEMTDVFVFGHFAGDDTTDATPSFFGATELTFEDTLGGGFGVGYNVSDYININGTVLFGSSEITIEPFFGSEDVFVVAPEINIDWNILNAEVTPFLTAGAGLMLLFGDDDDETEFSYGVGVGVRWDISYNAFMKVWYRARWFELDDTDDPFLQHSFNIGIGFML